METKEKMLELARELMDEAKKIYSLSEHPNLADQGRALAYLDAAERIREIVAPIPNMENLVP